MKHTLEAHFQAKAAIDSAVTRARVWIGDVRTLDLLAGHIDEIHKATEKDHERQTANQDRQTR